MPETTTEMACSLDQKALRNRTLMFRERLLPQALQINRTGDGLHIVFVNGPALRDELQTFIALERECCGFLDFELTEDLGESRLLLDVTGPVAAQAVLDQMQSVLASGAAAPTGSDNGALIRRTGVGSIATGVFFLLLCEAPVLLAAIGLGGLGAWLAFLQPTAMIEAGGVVLIFAGATAYVVWRKRTSHTQPAT